MILIKLCQRGVIVVPKEVRLALGWKEGDAILLQIENNRVMLSKFDVPGQTADNQSVSAAPATEEPVKVRLSPLLNKVLECFGSRPESLGKVYDRFGSEGLVAAAELEILGLIRDDYGYYTRTDRNVIIEVSGEGDC